MSKITMEPRPSALTLAQVAWLRSGHRGLSSEALFERLTGHVLCAYRHHDAHPHDPGDLQRCQLMLERCGLLERIGEAAGLSKAWGRLVPHWIELIELMDQENPTWREGVGRGCARAYSRMRALLDV